MLFNSALRLRMEVLWLFRLKSRLRYAGFKTIEETSFDQLDKGFYEVDCMFRQGQYQPHYLFNGKIQGGRGYAEIAGKAMKDGASNKEAARLAGVDPETISHLRKAINEYRGIPFMCKCGRIGGHPRPGNIPCNLLKVEVAA